MEERTPSRRVMNKKINYRLCGWTALFLVTVIVGETYLHRSIPYRVACEFIEQSTTVRHEVGTVRAASAWEGTIHNWGSNGWASFRMKVKGTNADAVVEITLRCHADAWTVDT